MKIFDAIEGVGGPIKPRLIMVSALDIRDPEKIPTHYVSLYIYIHRRPSFLFPKSIIE